MNHREEKHPGEVNNDKSMTQPNEVLSVKEIIARFTNGLPVTAYDDYYDDPEGFDSSDFDRMDFAQRHEFIQQHREYLEDLQARHKEQENPALPRSSDPEGVKTAAAKQSQAAPSPGQTPALAGNPPNDDAGQSAPARA